MATIADRVRAAIVEVDVGDGMHARIRRVVSKDLVSTGFPLLLASRRAKAATGTDAVPLTEEIIKREEEYEQAVVCAGVVELRDGEDPWERWTVVKDAPATRAEAEAQAKHRFFWVGLFSHEQLGRLAVAILDLSGRAQAAEAVATFHGTGTAADRSPGAPVPPTTDLGPGA